MGNYQRKYNTDKLHLPNKEERAVLEAWKRGERTAEEVAKITGYPLKTVKKYIPE